MLCASFKPPAVRGNRLCCTQWQLCCMQESGVDAALRNPFARLTVLAPTNAGLAIEQLGDLREVRCGPFGVSIGSYV